MVAHALSNVFARLTCLALIALAGVGGAYAAPVSTAFGTRTLMIPPPADFKAVSAIRADLLPIMQSYLPASNRLVEMYVADTDVEGLRTGTSPGLETYFQVQTLRAAEGVPFSTEEFTSRSSEMEQQLTEMFPAIDKLAGELTTQGNKSVKDQTGHDPEVSIGGTQFLGVSRREPWGLFFNMRSNVAAGSGDAQESTPMLASGALLLIDHQFLYLYGYKNLKVPSDLKRTQEAVYRWADAVHAANPDSPALEATAQRASGIDWTSVGTSALRGAIVGGLIGLVLWGIGRLRKS